MAPAPPGTFRIVRRMFRSLDAMPPGDWTAPELDAEGQFIVQCAADALLALYDDEQPRAYWQRLGNGDYWVLLARVANMMNHWVPSNRRDGVAPPYHLPGAQRRRPLEL